MILETFLVLVSLLFIISCYIIWNLNKKLESLLLEKFSRIEFDKDLMGGAIMVAAYK